MDKLWAPWRARYIRSTKSRKCIFCQSLKSPKKNYVLLESKFSFCVQNTFPYNTGHIMVVPRRHVGDITRLKDEEVLDLFKLLNRVKKILDKILKPQGYNLGMNISDIAGAGITSHLHIHLVPRWRGDTNFMPVISDTKVISQSLAELYKKFRKYAQSKRD